MDEKRKRQQEATPHAPGERLHVDRVEIERIREQLVRATNRVAAVEGQLEDSRHYVREFRRERDVARAENERLRSAIKGWTDLSRLAWETQETDRLRAALAKAKRILEDEGASDALKRDLAIDAITDALDG